MTRPFDVWTAAFVRLSPGVSLFTPEVGGGPPLLLLHGLLVSGEMFAPLVPRLARTRRLLIPDLRGHGRSGQLPGPYSVPQLAHDLLGLLDAKEIAEVDVLGYSQGGAVAQQFALEHPERVRRLALVCTYAFNRLSPGERLEGLAMPVAVRLLGTKTVARLAERAALRQGLDHTLAEQLRALVAANRTQPMVAAVRAALAFDSRSRLHELRCPVLIVAGERDTAVPPHHARLLAERIPGARLHLVQGAGHTLLWTHTARLADLLEAFLGGEGTCAQG